MWVAACVLIGLGAPLVHQLVSHNLHLRALRLVRPGLTIPVTEHERKHAARRVSQRWAADAGWLVWSAGWIATALAAR